MIASIIFVVFIFIFVSVVIFNCLYKRTNSYKNDCFDIESFQGGLTDNISMVNLGSTYSKFAFGSYDKLFLNAKDLSIQAQSVDVDYAIVKRYYQHFSEGCIVVICLAACCMLYEGNDNPLYCKIFKRKENPKYTLRAKLSSIFPLLLTPKKIKKIVKKEVKFNTIYDSVAPFMTDELSDKYLKGMADGWKTMFKLDDLKDPANIDGKNRDAINRNTEILKGILEFCLKNKFRPIIVVPPFSSKLNQYFSHDFTSEVIDNSVMRACDGKKIPFLNYQWDSEFANREDLFADQGFRLNMAGSEYFLRKLSNDLLQYNVVVNNSTCGR